MAEKPSNLVINTFLQFSRKMLIFRGVLLALLGILIFTNLPKVLATVTMIAGILLLIDGIFNLAGVIADQKRSLWGTISAIVLIVFGVILLKHPLTFDTFLLMFIGAWILFNGVQEIVFGFTTSKPWTALLLGILSCIVGGIFLATPWLSLITYGWIIGTLLCVSGIATAITGITLKAEN